MTAKEAKDISKQKSVTLEGVLERVNTLAEVGQTCVRYFDIELSLEVIAELIKLGYSVKEIEGPIGERIITIRW